MVVENEKLASKINTIDRENKELKSKLQQIQITEKANMKTKNESELLIKKLQTDLFRQQANIDKSNVLNKEKIKLSTESYGPDKSDEELKFDSKSINQKLRSEISEKDALIKRLNHQLVAKENDITKLQVHF
jgi:hypothetical protein